MGGTRSSAMAFLLRRLCLCVLMISALSCAPGQASARATARDIRSISAVQAVHRVLVQNENSSESVSALTTRTERVDPLDGLRKYRGGYNITNKHYWSSVVFTGIYAYGIAVIWLIGGLVYAGILVITALCFKKKAASRGNKRPLCFKRYCLWPILLGVLFTLLAIVASGVALGGSLSFHSRAQSVKNIIATTVQEATGTIYNITEAVRAMQEDPELQGHIKGASRLNSTIRTLNDEAARIQDKTLKNMRLVNKGIIILKVVTVVTVSLNIVVVLAMLASAPLRFRRALRLLIIISWLLTALFWIYFGLYFFLHKFAGDTCAALDEYQQDPQNSTLSSILPCNDQRSAQSVLRDSGAGIHNIINQVNANISRLQTTLPGLEYICNPISGPPEYNYQPENCSSNTIKIGDIPQILKVYTCSGGDGGTCNQGEFIPANVYSTALVYTSSIQNILDAFPGMLRLVNCQLVKDAFSEILLKQCRPLMKYGHMSWAALATLSTIMVVLVLTWTLGAHHDSRCHSSDCSVKPQETSTDAPEVYATEMGSQDHEIILHSETKLINSRR